MNPAFSGVQSIAVVQLGRLGDAILTTPLFVALRDLFSNATITAIASPAAASILQPHVCVDDVPVVGRGVIGIGGAMIRMRSVSFDLYIDPKNHGSSTSRMLAKAVQAAHTIAHPLNATDGIALGEATIPSHFVDRMLAPLSIIAPDYVPDRRPMLTIPDDSTIEAARIRLIFGSEYAVVNISAGSPSRQWPADRAVALVRWISRNQSVVVVSAPNDRAIARRIAAAGSRVVSAETRGLLEVAAIVAGASLVVSPDTSVVHVASAFDIPTVALYPNDPANHRLFAPLATHSISIVAREGRVIAGIDTAEVIEGVRAIQCAV